MPDTRTRRQKLEAMAAQTASPNEAEVAKRLLAQLDEQTLSDNLRFDGPPLSEVIDDFFAGRMTVDYMSNGIRVEYDGGIEPGVIGAMLREALRGTRAPQVD